MWNKKMRPIPFLCAAFLCLTACGGKEGPTPPKAYGIAGDSLPALGEVLGDGGGVLTSLEAPEEGTDPDQQQYVYTYQELPAAGGQTVSDYMARLLEEDSDVQVVDAAGGTADPPDFAAEEGSLWLAKPSAQEGSRLSLRLDWTGSGCTVTVARPQGAVEAPEPDPMTNDDAVRYIQSLSPSLLGLDGSSMGKYEIYPVEGAVLVDHTPCLRLQVYYRDPEAETNRVVGIYLLTGDRQHLYKLDQDRSHVSELT